MHDHSIAQLPEVNSAGLGMQSTLQPWRTSRQASAQPAQSCELHLCKPGLAAWQNRSQDWPSWIRDSWWWCQPHPCAWNCFHLQWLRNRAPCSNSQHPASRMFLWKPRRGSCDHQEALLSPKPSWHFQSEVLRSHIQLIEKHQEDQEWALRCHRYNTPVWRCVTWQDAEATENICKNRKSTNTKNIEPFFETKSCSNRGTHLLRRAATSSSKREGSIGSLPDSWKRTKLFLWISSPLFLDDTGMTTCVLRTMFHQAALGRTGWCFFASSGLACTQLLASDPPWCKLVPCELS